MVWHGGVAAVREREREKERDLKEIGLGLGLGFFFFCIINSRAGQVPDQNHKTRGPPET